MYVLADAKQIWKQGTARAKQAKALEQARKIAFAFNDLCFEAPDSSADPVASFERGITQLEQQKRGVFGSEEAQIRYDIKKTDSLVTPIIGIVTVQLGKNSKLIAHMYRFQFSYQDGRWRLAEYSASL